MESENFAQQLRWTLDTRLGCEQSQCFGVGSTVHPRKVTETRRARGSIHPRLLEWNQLKYFSDGNGSTLTMAGVNDLDLDGYVDLGRVQV